MSLVIETKDLVKIYGSEKSGVRALDGVNIKVPKGSVFGLFGPNGAGKTTLISILVGLSLPTRGSASVLGYDVIRNSVEIRKRVGLLPEGVGFYDHMTALENLRFLGALEGMKKDEVEKRAIEVLGIVGLKDKANSKVATFSRGMKQRLGLAQALLKGPELLILDEPTVGIDPQGVAEFRELVRKLSSEEGKTILMSTHLLYEVGMLVTHAAIIRKGKILAQGSVEELSKPVIEAKGYTFEVQVKSGGELLLQELKSLPEIKEVMLKNNKITIVAKKDIRETLFSLTNKEPFRGNVESLAFVNPSWDELYQFYQGGEIKNE